MRTPWRGPMGMRVNQTTPCATVIQRRAPNLNPLSKASGKAIATSPEFVRLKFAVRLDSPLSPA